MMTNSSDENMLRAELAQQYKKLGEAGLNELSSGNVSCRIDDHMLISASGASADNIEPDAVVKMSLDGEWEGERKNQLVLIGRQLDHETLRQQLQTCVDRDAAKGFGNH